ncbi:MAG: hypothetical protein IJ690_07030 [Clostridia bacterium]|nr:hypothetical protein [Clostridia bacterium]
MPRDVLTIDAMSSICFRDTTAKECWASLIDSDYFKSKSAQVTMDFARRWAKVMQHMMHNEGKPLNEVIIPAANEANIENNVGPYEKKLASELLASVWFEGETFMECLNSMDHQGLYI